MAGWEGTWWLLMAAVVAVLVAVASCYLEEE
jgi:hypothetical protein